MSVSNRVLHKAIANEATAIECRRVLSEIIPFARAIIWEAIERRDDDAGLLGLGFAFLNSWEAETSLYEYGEVGDGTARAARTSTGDIVRIIEGVPAKTLAGLQVKVLAIRWAQAEDDVGVAQYIEGPCADVLVADSIVTDLFRMITPPFQNGASVSHEAMAA